MTAPVPTAESDYAANAKYQRPWYWYDWANSAFVTTTLTVLIGPYLTSVAKKAACPTQDTAEACQTTLYVVPSAAGWPAWLWISALIVAVVAVVIGVFGLARIIAGSEPRLRPGYAFAVAGLAAVLLVLSAPLDPGSVASYTVTLATLSSAVLLIVVGAIGDRSPRPARLLGGFAWVGSIAAAALFFLVGTNWRFGAAMTIVATICLGSSLVIYDSILCRIADPDSRDRVSSRGWALGYLGGGLLLAANLVVVSQPELIGVDTTMAVRLALLSAGVWWGVFTFIPVIGMWRLRGGPVDEDHGSGRELVRTSFSQLRHTFADMRHYPQTMTFLLAYLFFNDGIQTVIYSSSIYGVEELGFSQGVLISLILLVQFVAVGGALAFGRFAARWGAWRTVLGSLVAWSGIVITAFFLPAGVLGPFLVLGALIGIVLGGSQALSRSLYSQLVPRGREAEYFSFYQAMERGTSWFGTLLFGLVHQLTHSYRPAIIALVFFFVAGGLILRRVDMRKGILDAGNELPAVV